MSVEFQEDQNAQAIYQRIQQSQSTSGLTNMLIKMGLAVDEAGANKVMIIIMILSLSLTAFVIFKFIL